MLCEALLALREVDGAGATGPHGVGLSFVGLQSTHKRLAKRSEEREWELMAVEVEAADESKTTS